VFRELVTSSGSGFGMSSRLSAHFLIQGRELFPISRYYPDATVCAVVGAIFTLVIDATELIGALRDGFVVKRLSDLASPVVHD